MDVIHNNVMFSIPFLYIVYSWNQIQPNYVVNLFACTGEMEDGGCQTLKVRPRGVDSHRHTRPQAALKRQNGHHDVIVLDKPSHQLVRPIPEPRVLHIRFALKFAQLCFRGIKKTCIFSEWIILGWTQKTTNTQCLKYFYNTIAKSHI